MNEPDILPAPTINWPPTPTKLEREKHAFQLLLPDLLKTYRGKYAAVHEGKVVCLGDEKLPVLYAAWKEFGNVSIYVGLVTDEIQPPVRLPHFREVRSPQQLHQIRY